MEWGQSNGTRALCWWKSRWPPEDQHCRWVPKSAHFDSSKKLHWHPTLLNQRLANHVPLWQCCFWQTQSCSSFCARLVLLEFSFLLVFPDPCHKQPKTGGYTQQHSTSKAKDYCWYRCWYCAHGDSRGQVQRGLHRSADSPHLSFCHPKATKQWEHLLLVNRKKDEPARMPDIADAIGLCKVRCDQLAKKHKQQMNAKNVGDFSIARFMYSANIWCMEQPVSWLRAFFWKKTGNAMYQ